MLSPENRAEARLGRLELGDGGSNWLIVASPLAPAKAQVRDSSRMPCVTRSADGRAESKNTALRCLQMLQAVRTTREAKPLRSECGVLRVAALHQSMNLSCRRNRRGDSEAREHAVPYFAGERTADQEMVDRLEGLVAEDAGRAVGKRMAGAALRGPATVEGD